jgi:MraZ protein
MFRGSYTTRVDEKGRIKVPAEYKHLIDEKYGIKFYITSVDGNVAQLYPLEVWEKIERKLAEIPNFTPAKQKYLDRTNYYGQLVEMDGQGRLLIPPKLRESAAIKGVDVTVVGQQSYLEVRNQAAYEQEVKGPLTSEDRTDFGKLGI